MTRTRRIVLGSALALLVGIVLWVLLDGGAPQSVVLSDGTRVTFHSVSVGTNESFRTGNALRRMADKLPRQWAKKYGTRHFVGSWSPETNLFLKLSSDSHSQFFLSLDLRLADDAGTYAVVEFVPHSRVGLPSGGKAWLYPIDVWPRRSRNLYFSVQALTGGNGRTPAAVWRVKNPLGREYPQWQPEVLPVRRAVGKRVFVLEELVEDQPTELLRGRLPPPGALVARARLQVSCAGELEEGSEIAGAQFRDATGNRVRDVGRASAERTGRGELSLRLSIPLLAGERAGKLGIAFAPTKEIPPGDVVWMRGLDVRRTQSTILSFTTNSLFGPLEGWLRISPVTSQPTTEHESGDGTDVTAYMRTLRPEDLDAPDARCVVVLEAIDDQARTYAPTNSPDGNRYSRTFKLPPDVQTLDLKLATPRIVFVEYTVGRESITPVPKKAE